VSRATKLPAVRALNCHFLAEIPRKKVAEVLQLLEQKSTTYIKLVNKPLVLVYADISASRLKHTYGTLFFMPTFQRNERQYVLTTEGIFLDIIEEAYGGRGR
jgi:hypothetical protein